MVHSEVIPNATPFGGADIKVKEKKPTAKREGKTGTGSRRIFSPEFKLRVLDSYRTDDDCQFNQRATARKYGIHRRQIQKWLQMEDTLRTSVRKQQQQAQAAAATSAAAAPTSILNLRVNNRVTESAEKASSKRSPAEEDQPNANGESEEYVNVDEITDNEDDSSSCSSLGKSWSSGDDRALDFTNATLSKRRSYSKRRLHTTAFKANVLREFCDGDQSCKDNQSATALGIAQAQVQKWILQENASSSPSPPKVDHLRRIGCLGESTPAATTTKRKSLTPEIEPKAKRSLTTVVQESALCLVKDETQDGKFDKTVCQLFPAATVSPPYPCSLEHSAAIVNYSSYFRREYSLPFYIYQQPPPWSCCYQQIAAATATASPPSLSIRSNLEGSSGGLLTPKYSSYSLNLKYETPYADIPVQYGFGDSVPSKWLPPPFYTHEYPSIQLLSSYR